MPLLTLKTWEGLTKEQKTTLVEEFTESCCRVLGCPPEAVSVLIEELPKENWGAAGQLCTERFPDQ